MPQYLAAAVVTVLSATKNSGAAEGHSTAPYSTRPGWGARGRPGPGRMSGDGLFTHPPGSLRRRGRRLPAGRPELVYSPPPFKAGAPLHRVPAGTRGPASA